MRLFLFVVLVGAVLCEDAIYAADSLVVPVTDDTWHNVTDSEDLWVLVFCTTYNGHCRQVGPIVDKVASNLKGMVSVGGLDCGGAAAKTCSAMGIKNYPVIRFLSAEKTFNPYTGQAQKSMNEFQGAANAKDIVNSALKQMPFRVQSVNDTSAEDFLDDVYPKVLLFSQKAEVSSLYKSLSWQFRERIRFGQASDKDAALVKKFAVTKFPHVVVIPAEDASKAITHDGAIKREELAEFLSKHALPERTADPGTPERRKMIVRMDSLEAFDSSVLKDSERPWLVLFDKGKTLQATMQTIAISLSSIVKVAIIDAASPSASALLSSQEVKTFPTIRLYQADKSDVDEFVGGNPSQPALLSWLDDKLTGFVSKLELGEPMNAFLQKCLKTPCIFYFANQIDPPMLIRLVSIEHHKKLHFGMISNPPTPVLQQFGVSGKLPKVMVFFSQNGTMEALAAMPYTGNLDVEGLNAFANSLVKKQDTPKSSTVDRAAQPLQEISGENPLNKICSGAGLCAVAFIDGSNDEIKKENLAVFEKVRVKKSGSPYRFSWVDAICQPEIAAAFDVTSDKLPTVVVISPGKMRQRQLMGVYDVDTITGLLDGILSGKTGTSPFSEMPATSSGDCKKLHEEYQQMMSAAAAPAEEDDPIMAEVLAAARQREEEERKLRPKTGDDDDDDEPKKKKKKKKKKTKKD